MTNSFMEKIKAVPQRDAKPPENLIHGTYKAIENRRIAERTCKLFDYTIGEYRRQPAQFANYRDENGIVVSQHVRYGEKLFAWVNRSGDVQLFGQHLGGEGMLIITEGEIDAMSVYECLQQHRRKHKFVVASIPDGAQSAKKACTAQLSWILGFKRVVLFMDQDQPGRKAAADLAALIGPTAQVVGAFPYKDANEAWVADDFNSIIEAINNAKRQRPDAIVHAPDLLGKILKLEHRMGLPYPWAGWNHYTEGMKPGQLVMISGGTGIGKSLFTRSIALNLCQQGINVAYIGLEESCETSVERMLSEVMGEPFHLDTPTRREERSPELIQEKLNLFADRLYLLDKFGSDDFDSFVATVKHYVLSEQCKVVVLDHFSLLADGISLATDQRRAIDRCIKDLKTLCVQLDFTMLVVCHLSRVGGYGKSHEEGGEPTLAELRGSHSLAQIPDFVVMLQRNPRAEDKIEANTTSCWLKKNRVKGELGLMAKLHYQSNCQFHEVQFI